MLGESFFAIGYEMTRATSFAQVSPLFLEKLRPEFGASEIILFDFSNDLSIIHVVGDGPIAEGMRQNIEGVEDWLRANWQNSKASRFGIAQGPNGENMRDMPNTKEWLSRSGLTDIVGGTLFRGAHRSACFGAVTAGEIFTEDQRERIEAAVLVLTGALSRLVNDNYERRVLERLMGTRNETRNAVFVVKGKHVIPYNPGAVQYADTYWGKDDVEFELSEESSHLLKKGVTAAWNTVVEPLWITLELDIGGGPIPIGAIARPDGNVLFLFSPPARQTPSTVVPMLTRRQCDIMDWIAEGKTSAEVAIILEISPRTVEKHLEAIFQRFGVENRVAAVRSYLEAKGELSPGPVPN